MSFFLKWFVSQSDQNIITETAQTVKNNGKPKYGKTLTWHSIPSKISTVHNPLRVIVNGLWCLDIYGHSLFLTMDGTLCASQPGSGQGLHLQTMWWIQQVKCSSPSGKIYWFDCACLSFPIKPVKMHSWAINCLKNKSCIINQETSSIKVIGSGSLAWMCGCLK